VVVYLTKKKVSPYIIIILGFAGVIAIGTSLLLLPFATYNNVSVIDALFTSTSAVCVTGLVSVPTVAETYTLFGKIVIFLLIEIGGLGFVTITIFIFTLLGLKIGMKDRFLIKESLNQNSLKGMVKLVRVTVIITLTVQIVGGLINFIVFKNYYSFWTALGISLFHSVSAFNNAGFDLFSAGTSLIPYQNNLLLNINTSLLIIFGGIGFIVIYDILKRKSWKRLSIHSKIVIKTSLGLIIFGAIFLKISEGANITWLQAYFSSVAARTAGFATTNFNLFANSSIIIILVLMYIGASPSSTGGGIKTTTFYTVSKYIASFAKGKQTIAYNRKIATSSVVKAFILIILSLSFISVVILLVSFVERFNTPVITGAGYNQHNYFTQIVFEVFSAFGTVGFSMGITSDLHWLSKFIIVITMFFGRLGPITIISAWNKHWNINTDSTVKYIEEKIIIG